MNHHLDDATVLAYASGTLPRTLSLVAEAHIEMCAACRSAVRAGDAIGGAMLRGAGEIDVSNDTKARVMGRIGTAIVHRMPQPSQRQRGDIPKSLRPVLRFDSLDEIAWKRSVPGVKIFHFPKYADETGFFGLLRISPGFKIPEHGHGGTELTMILKGSYHDELGQFGPGDIADHDESIQHTPVASGEDDCICLVATEAPTRFRSWPARIVQKLIGI